MQQSKKNYIRSTSAPKREYRKSKKMYIFKKKQKTNSMCII